MDNTQFVIMVIVTLLAPVIGEILMSRLRTTSAGPSAKAAVTRFLSKILGIIMDTPIFDLALNGGLIVWFVSILYRDARKTAPIERSEVIDISVLVAVAVLSAVRIERSVEHWMKELSARRLERTLAEAKSATRTANPNAD
jgi:hypothetical protein